MTESDGQATRATAPAATTHETFITTERPLVLSPRDAHNVHVWCLEPTATKGVLTKDGLQQIAVHKYHAGKYTTLDNWLNPVWSRLTLSLPPTMAPNVVTTIGFGFFLLSYGCTWYYTPNYDRGVPRWVLLLNAACAVVCYTLDCMDGKQARRTNSSSPLGQLFDHGIDCLGTLCHFSNFQAWAMLGGSPLYFAASQVVCHHAFFMAQWEEYHTGVLPHATGDFGVTEVSYGLALLSALNAIWSLQDREKLYSTPVLELLPFVDKDTVLTHAQRFFDVILRPLCGDQATSLFVTKLPKLQLNQAFILLWCAAVFNLMVLSIYRVSCHSKSWRHVATAVSKLLSPTLLAVAPFFLPTDILLRETRFVSLTTGLAFCLITIKMIVFSMARQAYSMIQFDVVPLLTLIAWTRLDSRLRPPGIHLLWQTACLWYLYRIFRWTRYALAQICHQLNIQLFALGPPKPLLTTVTKQYNVQPGPSVANGAAESVAVTIRPTRTSTTATVEDVDDATNNQNPFIVVSAKKTE